MSENFPKFIKETITKEDSRKRNSPWSRDELILALDLYFDFYPSIPSPSNPKIIELCEILNNLNKQIQLRTADSIVMKLSNFLRLDPRYSGIGLSKGSKLENIVWKDFSNKPSELRRVALHIKKLIFSKESIYNAIDLDDEEFEEECKTFINEIAEETDKWLNSNKELIKELANEVLDKKSLTFNELILWEDKIKLQEINK